MDLFQENIIRTIIQLEKVYDDLAKLQEECVLIICDRGVMDPSACETPSHARPYLPT